MHCRGMELDSHGGRSNARNKGMTRESLAGFCWGSWNSERDLKPSQWSGGGSLLFLLLDSEQERGGDPRGSPTAMPYPSTRSNAWAGLDGKETELGNQPWRMLWLTWQVYKNAKISDIIKDTKSVLTRGFFFVVFFFFNSNHYSARF